MGLVSSTAETPPVTARRASAAGRGALWLILGCYLAGAVAVTWRLWAGPAGRMQAGDPHDVDLFAWYLRYAATAVSHGRLPALFTTALNPPQGVNLMWNTSVLLPGILLTPLTLVAGPQVSLTVMLTLGLAGSAASMLWMLRRWGASLTAAAVGGAVYGFSPAMVNSGIGHYHLVLAMLPPLIIDALLRIVTGRGNPLKAGAWLGGLAAAQLFVAEEMLIDTAVAGLVLVAVLAASRPRAAVDRARGVACGLVTSAAVMLLICGYPLWVQLAGPQKEHSVLLVPWAGRPSFLVDPPGSLLLHTRGGAAAAHRFALGLPEVLAYLGWPLLVVLVAATIWFWRDLRVRAAAVTFVMLQLCSLGGASQPRYPGWLLPWHWMQGLPGLAQLMPDRFAILADGAAAAVLAFSLDLAWAAVPPASRRWRRRVPAAVAVLALVPLIPLPYHAVPATPVPAGWQAAFARLHLAPGARVLVVPIPNVGHTQAMRWQADTGEPSSMIGGYFFGPGPAGQAMFDSVPARMIDKYVDWLWAGRLHASRSSVSAVRPALAAWRPAAVIADAGPDSGIGRVLVALFGHPSFRSGVLLVWRR